MGIRKYKPTTPGRRGSSVADFVEVTRSTPEKSLLAPGRRPANVTTRPDTTRHTAAASRPTVCGLKHDKDGVPPRSLTSSTTRTAPPASHCCTRRRREALHHRAPGAVQARLSRPVRARTSVRQQPLRNIPVGTTVHAVEPVPWQRQARCAAGAAIQLVAARASSPRCVCPRARCAWSMSAAAPRSVLSATPSSRTSTGARPAAGWKGVRPTVRGVAMNPIDHPHGGGEGKTSGGRHPVSP